MKYKPFEEIFVIPLKNGLTKPKRIRGKGFKMVNMGELFSYSRMINIPMDRVPLTEKEKESFMLEDGDLLFARQSLVREGAGQCSIFLEDYEKVCFESHLIRCRLDKEKSNPLFYYYYFRSRAGKIAIDAIVEQGAGAAGIRGSDLKKLMVPDVDKAVQDSVANKIDSIDQKIYLNRQINQTLESMSQAIFKSWFVDFDPVKAKIAAIEAGEDAEGVTLAAMRAISGKTDDELDKMEGGQPEDYAKLKTTAELFPASMQNSELEGVPEGWKIGKLKDIIDIIKNPLKSGEHLKDRKYLTIDNLSMRKIWIEKFQEYSEAKSSLIAFEKNDILLGAMRVYFHRVNLSPFSGIARTTTFVLRPKKKDHLSFSLFLMNQESTINYANSHSKGTTMPYAVWGGSLSEMEAIIPNDEILTQFNHLIYPSLNKIRDQIFEQKNLSKIRDALIPKLMSEKIRVTNIR